MSPITSREGPMIRKLFALAGLLIACVGIGLFIALGVSVWSIKTEVNKQSDTLATLAHRAGNDADRAIEFVRSVISQAETDLTSVRPAAKPSRPVSVFEMAMAQSASKRLAGSVDQAQGAVVAASDAVAVAEAALKVFDQAMVENPQLKGFLRVQPSQVDATQSTLRKAATELKQAQSALGGAPTQEQLNAVDIALAQAREFTDQLTNVVETARLRVEATKSTVDRWSWRIAMATTILCGLAAVGQLFMARFCWRTLRGLPA
jgi:hydrogenase maturation protease